MQKLSTEEIQRVEQELGVVLPTLYRILLLEIGYGPLGPGQGREIYHPSRIAPLYADVFDESDWLFNIYFPFGCSQYEQVIWVIDVRNEKAATIWHECHPDDWYEMMEWLPYDEWRATFLNERKPFSLEDIKVTGGSVRPVAAVEVDRAEKELSIRFPSGYREYVTRFGEGVFGGRAICIYPPDRILRELPQWRERTLRYWSFQEKGRPLPTRSWALECMILGDTQDGDELIVHPSEPERIYVLPRFTAPIYAAGDGLLAALERLCCIFVPVEPFEEYGFEPFESRG